MRRKSSKTLTDVKKLYQLLLFLGTSGNLGQESEKPFDQKHTLKEQIDLLNCGIKICDMEQKEIEMQPEESGLELIKRNLKDASREDGRRRTAGAEDSAAEERPRSDGDSGEVAENDGTA